MVLIRFLSSCAAQLAGTLFRTKRYHQQPTLNRDSSILLWSVENMVAYRGLNQVWGREVHKPLLGVADTNHLLSIHIWVMLGNTEQLIRSGSGSEAFQALFPTGTRLD